MVAASVLAARSGDGDVGRAGDGTWLVGARARMQGLEAEWLSRLSRFDRARGWAADGSLSCLDWLTGVLRLARSTAFEKLRVAHELERRPLVAAAFAAGEISYCAVREITRCLQPTPAVDARLIALARVGTVRQVAQAVRRYLLNAEQERPPADRSWRRGLRTRRLEDGNVELRAVLDPVEGAELGAVLDGMARRAARADALGEVSTRADRSRLAGLAGPQPRWLERRADALMALVRGDRPAGARYQVHVVVAEDGARLLGGEPLDERTTARIACDCSVVEHGVDHEGGPLRLGRLRRTWNASQRRAVLVRDDGCCRFPGCERTTVDIHHLRPWEDGGATDVDNGLLLCPQHHTAMHSGWTAAGDVSGTLVFHGPRARATAA